LANKLAKALIYDDNQRSSSYCYFDIRICLCMSLQS